MKGSGLRGKDKIRCFIAIELSDEIKRALGGIEDELKKSILGVYPVRSTASKAHVMSTKQTSNGVKWVKPENIHLTLKFIGHIETESVEKVKAIMDEAAEQARPFKLKLSQAGAFPALNRPRVIWIGIEEENKGSSQLAGIIDEKLSSLGIEKESRAFHPHLTLARVKFLKDKSSVKNAIAALKVPQIEMLASKITLFQSALTSKGSIYTALQEASF